MDPSLIAILALLASAAQVLILRVVDYYFPKGHTAVGDRIAAQKARFENRDVDDEIEEDEEE